MKKDNLIDHKLVGEIHKLPGGIYIYTWLRPSLRSPPSILLAQGSFPNYMLDYNY